MANQTYQLTVTERELATILAALAVARGRAAALGHDLPEFFHDHQPLTAAQIAQLAERLNCE